MPLVDKKDQAERWGPDKNKSLILYATSKEKKESIQSYQTFKDMFLIPLVIFIEQ